MFKNTASQKVIVYAIDSTTGLPKTGDAGNITGYISKDGGSATVTNDTNPTELDATNLKGLYAFDTTQSETNCDLFSLSPVSATANITLEPVVAYTITAPPTVADILTTQMTESYAADTVAPTLAQSLFSLLANLREFAITGTTVTAKKLDKSTTAETYTLNDAENPTSRTRAS